MVVSLKLNSKTLAIVFDVLQLTIKLSFLNLRKKSMSISTDKCISTDKY